ncbi:atrial natriuretic peptide receptor 1-like protein [Corchorus olitorius]|uniref:Atrial natriuretic peptide receptor 1-like protein n=1 Tax=Corchorus olitorius TaxID=93759 RepID=A0A1R3H9A8_9ROSI|nr:atrial natriuretic peptide receptor 1-like protein [Corchorus olitorius]
MSTPFDTTLNDSPLRGETSRKGKNQVDQHQGGSGPDVYPETPDARQIRAASDDQTPTLGTDKIFGNSLYQLD